MQSIKSMWKILFIHFHNVFISTHEILATWRQLEFTIDFKKTGIHSTCKNNIIKIIILCFYFVCLFFIIFIELFWKRNATILSSIIMNFVKATREFRVCLNWHQPAICYQKGTYALDLLTHLSCQRLYWHE